MTTPSKRNDNGGHDECTTEAEIGRNDKGKIGANRIERAMREIHDAAERKDQRQAERNQKIIDTIKQSVEDLLGEQHGGHDMGSAVAR